MAGGYDMIAFHDTRAAPVVEMSVSHRSSVEEYLPEVAEKAGLGAPLIGKPFTGGIHYYENGEIHVVKERY